jgi:hypothetical protein
LLNLDPVSSRQKIAEKQAVKTRAHRRLQVWGC